MTDAKDKILCMYTVREAYLVSINECPGDHGYGTYIMGAQELNEFLATGKVPERCHNHSEGLCIEPEVRDFSGYHVWSKWGLEATRDVYGMIKNARKLNEAETQP